MNPVSGAVPLIRVRDLTVAFPTLRGLIYPATGVNLLCHRGRTLGLVGESGCGKSITLRSLIRLIPDPGEIIGGAIEWESDDLLRWPAAKVESLRGREISMIFQDPTASLNPVHTVGRQVEEVLRVKLGLNQRDAHGRAIDLLDRVGIPNPRARARDYAHQFSGGMRQRCMIAIAIACEPRLLLADEPTTSLDMTIQDQILSLLSELQAENEMAMILVSHDFGVVARSCDDVAVMYAGHVVEFGSREEVLGRPRHPYTQALLSTAAELEESTRRHQRLHAIRGQPPLLGQLPEGCPFQARCEHATSACRQVTMELDRAIPSHASACPFIKAEDR